MPCHKLYLNLLWVVPQELENLDIEVVTITKIYWTFRESVIRVCFYGIQSNRSHPLPVKKTPTKFNIHLHSQSQSFRDLNEVLGYHALDNKDPLLEELLSFMSSIKKISLEKTLWLVFGRIIPWHGILIARTHCIFLFQVVSFIIHFHL